MEPMKETIDKDQEEDRSEIKEIILDDIDVHDIKLNHRSQKINSLKHNLWIYFSKSKGRVLRAHCTCMGGMISSCNHVSAALFRLETALRLGLSNPACTATPNDWLPNRSEVTP